MISKSNVSKPDYMKQLILGKIKQYTVPDGITEILPYTFYRCGYNNFVGRVFTGTVINLPDSITTIGTMAFSGGPHAFGGTVVNVLHTIPHIPSNLTSIGDNPFNYCEFPNGFIIPSSLVFQSLPGQGAIYSDLIEIHGGIKELPNGCFTNSRVKTVILHNGVEKLNRNPFGRNTILQTAYLPNSIIYTDTNSNYMPFYGCTNLEFVTLEQGFNASINLSNSTKYSRDTILGWFGALYDRTGLATNTLTIGSTNLAKMTAEDIAIATAKNWTIA